tara:strand:- start:8107 stop:11385 length:3279 start_codon:yes stop_codon:yes gene_type:complete
MAKDTIFIKFKPAGDKELLRAIRTLNNATKKTIQQQRLIEQRVSANTKLGKENTKQINRQASAFARLQSITAIYRNKMLLLSFAMTLASSSIIKLVKAAADLEEIMNKSEVVFGDSMEAVQQWADMIQASMGRSSTEMLKFASGLQDTFVPLGMVRAGAADVSMAMTQLAVDVASFSNKADADVLNDFQSALVGNHETVKKYGIIINESRMKMEAFRLGISDGNEELTESAKLQARVSLMVRGTTDAHFDAQRTADSYTNQVKALGAAWQTVQEDFGQALQKMVMPLIALGRHFANTKRLKAYLSVLSGVGLAFGIAKIKAYGFVNALKAVKAGLISTTGGLFAIVVVLGELIAHFMKADEAIEESVPSFDVYRDVLNKSADAWDKNAIKIAEAQKSLADFRATLVESSKALLHNVKLSYAQSDFEKEAIKLTKDRKGGIEDLQVVEEFLIKTHIRRKKSLKDLAAEEKSLLSGKDAMAAAEIRALLEQRHHIQRKQNLLEYKMIEASSLEEIAVQEKNKLLSQQRAEEKAVKSKTSTWNIYAKLVNEAFDEAYDQTKISDYANFLDEAVGNQVIGSYEARKAIEGFGFISIPLLDENATQEDVQNAINVMSSSMTAITNATTGIRELYDDEINSKFIGAGAARTQAIKEHVKDVEREAKIINTSISTLYGKADLEGLLDVITSLELTKESIEEIGDPTGEMTEEMLDLQNQILSLQPEVDIINDLLKETAYSADKAAIEEEKLAAKTNILERSFSNLSKASGGVTFSLNDMATQYMSTHAELAKFYEQELKLKKSFELTTAANQQLKEDNLNKVAVFKETNAAYLQALAEGNEAEAELLLKNLELKEELSEADKARIDSEAEKYAEQEAQVVSRTEANIEAATTIAGAWIKSAMQQSQANIQMIKSQANAQIASLRETRKYQKASDDDKKKMEDKIKAENNERIVKEFKQQQMANRASVVMDTAMAIMKITGQTGIFAAPWIAATVAMGLMQLEQINSAKPPTMATGGLVGGKRHSQGGTLIEAEEGEYVVNRDAVDAVGLEAMNRINQGSAGSSVNVSFAGNVMSDDFIESEAIPKIKEAIRRGADIGIS